ncbi:hypothetical protein [Rathayibacter sp. VKM Ac-2630]|uniref:hypothetical protein n=1 Tax=Rathayibacter sp. VKM Ac-2630 TaxID=1938617 RepID=UPI001F3825A0|nr:hypothetical protein [Rathayibacter sp. VKM Ac-2630]
MTWGEAKALLEDAAGDPGTAFGAELAGWAYPASTLQLIGVITAATHPKSTRALMPWVLERPASAAPPDEVAAAQAELEAGVVFS